MAPARGLRPGAWYRKHAALLVAVAALALAASYASIGRADDSVPDPGWVVVATSPTTNLGEVQTVNVNVESRSDVPVFDVEIRQCKSGVSYTTREDVVPDGMKCPNRPVSSAADQLVVRSSPAFGTAVQSNSGATIPFRAGQGVVPLGRAGSGPETLACDPDHACSLVVQVHLSGQFVYVVIPISFAVTDPLAGCGGTAAGVLATGGSDQMSETWSALTLDACKRPGAKGAATRASFVGEGPAVQNFAAGGLDLVYTAAGYNDTVGLGPPSSGRRPAVATPIALNAAVVAVGGGSVQPTGDKAPYPELRLTSAELSAIFGGGIPWVIRSDLPYTTGIFGRNPVLNGALFAQIPTSRPLAPSEAESSTWFVTNYFRTMSPADWIAPPPISSSTPRGATASIAISDPPFPNLDPFSGRPVLEKVTNSAGSSVTTNGGIWAITDLATAKALGMTPVSIENANGDFVAPTPASMAAAVATMKPDENGLLMPDPKATSAQGGVSAAASGSEPYPLTYVEYALAPAAPLVDTATCAPRPDSQKLLTDWLQYVVGDGQSKLPPGMVKLTPSLTAAAARTIPLVGASTGASTCGGGAGQGAPGSGATSGFPSSSPVVPLSSSIPGPFGVGPFTAAAADAGGPTKKSVLAAIPAFAGHRLFSSTDGILALLGIVFVTSLAAWITAGQPSLTRGPTSAGAPARPRVGPAALAGIWFGVALAGMGLVVYQLGPLLQQRDQAELLAQYRSSIKNSANESFGLAGVEAVDRAPEQGAPVGVLEIGALELQNVVVEGATSSVTEKGPGHVPGTAGLGQPGNSVVVARRNGYGGVFSELENLDKGDRILVTTTQGQSVYKVTTVRDVVVVEGDSTTTTTAPATTSTTKPSTTSTTSSTSATTTTSSPDAHSEDKSTAASDVAYRGSSKSKGSGSMRADVIYGPSDDDRITLVTSSSRAPWNRSRAEVAIAKLQDRPFEPTSQGGRTGAETGRGGDEAWSSVVLALMLYGSVVAGSVWLYRRLRFRTAYLVTIAPLVAVTVVTGEVLSRLFPAWS